MRVRLLAALLVLTACGSPAARSDSRTVTVLAASSLTGSFNALATEYEKAHPGTHIRLIFGASSTLARQAAEGAPGDVFAAASATTMKTVTDARLTEGAPVVFARNRLQIAVPKGNPGHVTGLADFARRDLRIAICAPQVPCGAAAAKAFEAAGITPVPDTLEQDVKATLAKVTSGVVDAALVYRTDVVSAGNRVHGIDFPESAKAVNDYPIAALHRAANLADARRFVGFVLSPEGQRVLRSMAFEAP